MSSSLEHQGNQTPQRIPGSAFLLTLGLATVLLFPTIFWPFDYDQGTFAYGGSAILRGGRPYIDFTDIKPPNIFYAYATAFTVFGENVRAIRLFDYFSALLTISLLFLLALRLWKGSSWHITAVMMSCLAYVMQYYIFGHWDTAQAESYSVPFLLGAVLLVVSDGTKLLLRSAVAGLCVAIAFYFKFPNGLFLVLIAVALWIKLKSNWPILVRANSCLIGGFIVGVGLQSLYLALNGELIPLWHTTFSSTANYVSTNYSGSFTILRNLRTSLNALGAALVMAALLGWSYWAILIRTKGVRRQPIRGFWAVPVFGSIIALIIVQVQNKGYTYHYAVFLPWADLLIGLGVSQIVTVVKSDGIRRAFVVLVPVAILMISYLWSSSTPLHQRLKELLQVAHRGRDPNGYITGDTIANYVATNTRPTDHIFIFGFQPYVYWKSGRRPATKYLNTIHFKPSYVNLSDREELVHSLCGNPPALFLVETKDRYSSQGSTNDDSRTTIRLRYPELEKLLAERYTPRDTIQNTIAYFLHN